jgi:cytidylate kinase
VAQALGGYHLDSGALYRGLTRVALDAGSEQPAVIKSAAEARGLELRLEDREIVPYLDGRPAESRIRSSDVTAAVSALSALPALRDWVNQRLRVAATGDRILVLDGRDIGTAVFPAALLKIFLTATPEARARRRLEQRGDDRSAGAVAAEAALLAARDVADSNRSVAPLRRADDAVVIDTTDMSFEEQVSAIVRRAEAVLS